MKNQKQLDLSTLPEWQENLNKFRVLRDPRPSPTLDDQGAEIPDPVPLTLPYKLPTMEERVREFERLDEARLAQYYDGDLAEDEFLDDLDDIDPISPHEAAAQTSKKARWGRRKAADAAAQADSKEPPAGPVKAQKTPSVVTEGVSPPGEGS